MADRYRSPAHSRLPVSTVRREVDLAEYEIDDAVQDVVLVGDVVVERHRLDLELLTEPAHGERLDPARIGENQGGAQNALPAQGRSRLGIRVGLGGHLHPLWVAT